MTSYDPTLPTDLDWVRFLIGDTSQDPVVHDEEIQAFIDLNTSLYQAGVWIRYFTAADILDALVQRWRVKQGNVTSKSVSRLSISYGGTEAGMKDRAGQFRARGAELLLPRPKMFKTISIYGC